MQKFKSFLSESEEYDQDEPIDQEQHVQNKLFGINDYIPFVHKEITESIVSPESIDADTKRIVFKATPGEHTAANGLAVPRHMWTGTTGTEAGSINRQGNVSVKGSPRVVGMDERNVHRAKVYGSEHRPPLGRGKIQKIHHDMLDSHFSMPEAHQVAVEKAAIARLKAAKHLDSGTTLDKGEKTDTVKHEYDEQGRSFVGYSAKGVAGHALYTSGSGENQKHHIINTCPAQTTGCGGGVDKEGIADPMRGNCFAPKTEQRLPRAAIRRATHEQAKHDPAMTRDWFLAHIHSLRKAAYAADKENKRMLFRPNVVDETDTTSRHAIAYLNKQREAKGRPPIVGNSYSKTGEMHDPDNNWHVTHSNVGPKVKNNEEITENKKRDTIRQRETISAVDATGKDKVNDQGKKTPPKNSYLVASMKRGSPLDKQFQEHVTHAKYWSSGREEHELSEKEKQEEAEGHYDGRGKLTTPDKAHYGHITIKGEDGKQRRYDYQKQHVLHPRLVNVDGHLIPTDSRFKDDEFLPKERFKTKNGKKAGALLITSPTLSTTGEQHDSSFTHHVDDSSVDHAKLHGGEYEIDNPYEQERARGKEYSTRMPMTFKRAPKKTAKKTSK